MPSETIPQYYFSSRQDLELLESTGVDTFPESKKRLLRLAPGMHQHPRALHKLIEGIAVIPMLEAISNNISALPMATSVGQPASGQRAPGGFASTLAVAQSQPTSQPATGNASGSSVPAAGSAGVASKLDVRTPAWGNPQAKKLPLGSPALTANHVAAVNTGAPEIMPVVIPVPVSGSQILSVPPLNLAQLNLAPSGISSAVSSTQFPEAATGTVRAGLQTTVLAPVAQSTPADNSALSQTAVPVGSLISSGSAGGKIMNPSEVTALVPNVNWIAPSQESARSNSGPPVVAAAPAAITPGGASPNPSSDIQWNLAQNASWSAGSMPLKDIQPNAASRTEQPVTVTPPATGGSGQQGNVSGASGVGSWPTELALVPSGTFDFTPPAPTILAQATSNAGAGAPPDPVMGNEIAPASQSNALPPVQSDLPAQTTMGNPPSGIIGDPGTATSLLNPPDQLGMGTAELRFAAPKGAVAGNAPRIRGIEQHAAAPSSTAASASSAGPDLSQQSPLVGQTPFSIFFSGAGPGTESAAGTLPKMILPGAGSATGGNPNAGADGSSASPQTKAPQNGNAHNAALQTLKDPAVRTESASPPAAQLLRGGGGGNPASGETAVAQIATAPTPAATTGAVTLPVGALPALAADAVAKASPSSTTPGSAAAMPETLPVAVAGPVQMAQLISRVEQAEMRIGMNTSAFGSVEVRAVVHANDVGLVVGSEKGDLRSLLSNELPTIANTLQEQNLRLHSVNFMQGFAFSNNASSGGDSQPRPFIPLREATDVASREVRVDDSSEAIAPAELGGGHNNLNILA